MYSNELQAYAAGFLEGILTEDDIYIQNVNLYVDDKEPSDFVKMFLSVVICRLKTFWRRIPDGKRRNLLGPISDIGIIVVC